MSIEDLVNNPKHYNSHWSGIEAIEFTEQLMGNLSNAFKYVYRHESKWNAIEDIQKALWYLSREEKRLKLTTVFFKTDVLDRTFNEHDFYCMPNDDDFIYNIIEEEPSYMSKALYYIWCAQFVRDKVENAISKAKHYINLILEQKRKQLSNKEN